MLDDATVINAPAGPAAEALLRSVADAYPLLRQLGGKAHQLCAAARAADHFLSQESSADRDTGAWLISSAFGIADELAADLDNLAKSMRDLSAEGVFSQALRPLRARAHQLHAATRAADHFLEQDSYEDRSTGSWLIAYARGVADKLASELEDLASSVKRGVTEASASMSASAPDAGALRRGSSNKNLRGV